MQYSCLFGDPVEHSTSPQLYDFFARQFGIEYSHIKIQIPQTESIGLRRGLQALRSLRFVGANITMPYKQKVVQYLDEITPTARKVGAVNTIANKQGILIGHNTDGIGALNAIQNKLGKIALSDSVIIFGSGGAARAIAWEILGKTRKVVILNRKKDFSSAISLRHDFKVAGRVPKVDYLTKSNILHYIARSTFIINATSVGMSPQWRDSLVPSTIWSRLSKTKELKSKKFFDAVFNPLHTIFLKTAQRYGAQTCSGMDMMVFQGAIAFQLWTGYKPSPRQVKEAIRFMYTTINET